MDVKQKCLSQQSATQISQKKLLRNFMKFFTEQY